jgi:carbon storage regulator CsrA
MLVLSRKIGECVVIELPGGEKVAIKLIDFKGGSQARLGFEAPASVQISRQEATNRLPKTGRN